jgi:hypothetical protein
VVNIRELSRGQTGGTKLHGLRDRKLLQAAAEWLQDCGWFRPDTLPRTGGRPRSDFLIADGLWVALDDHACQNRQIRQNTTPGDPVGGSVDFGGFVGKDQKLAPDRTPGRVPAGQASDGNVPAAPAASTPHMIASERRPDIPAESSVLVRLDEMIAKKRAADRKL